MDTLSAISGWQVVMAFESVVLVLPGLGNSGEGHWQTIWEQQHGFRRVQQQDWDTPACADWIAAIDQAATDCGSRPVILAAHSLACTAVAYWAGKYRRSIRGALLVAPSDTEADTYPPGTTGFAPIPTGRLPFPSIVVASTNDYYVPLPRATALARAWGSQLVTVGQAGHLNAAAGFGPWPAGLELLQRLDQPQERVMGG